jgi:hypothetical protein
MKKIPSIVFAMSLLLNCTDNTGIQKATKAELSSFLSTNTSYKKFIDAHYDNILSLSSLNDDQSKQVGDFSRNIYEDKDALNVRKKSDKIYEMTGMNPKAIEYYFSFTNDLNAKFRFDENDLTAVIRTDLEEKNNFCRCLLHLL